MEGCVKFDFLIDLNPGYFVAGNELAKNVVEKVGKGQLLCNCATNQF